MYSSSPRKLVCVVSSCSRGIGLEFTKRILDSGNKVIGLCRNNNRNPLLSKLEVLYPNSLHIISGVDLQNQQSIDKMEQEVLSQYERIDMLINVSAILSDDDNKPERSLVAVKRDWLNKSLDVNLIGHIMVTKALFPLLTRRERGDLQSESVSKVVNLSARVGSISDNKLGGWFSYRVAKAALNQFTKTLSVEGKRDKVVVVSMHPGTTDTDLSKPFQNNVQKDKLFSVEYSVDKMMKVIDQLELSDTGKFFAYDGSLIDF